MVRSKAVRTRATTTSARKAKTGFQRKATQVEKLRIQIQGAEKTLKNLVEVRKKIPKKSTTPNTVRYDNLSKQIGSLEKLIDTMKKERDQTRKELKKYKVQMK